MQCIFANSEVFSDFAFSYIFGQHLVAYAAGYTDQRGVSIRVGAVNHYDHISVAEC